MTGARRGCEGAVRGAVDEVRVAVILPGVTSQVPRRANARGSDPVAPPKPGCVFQASRDFPPADRATAAAIDRFQHYLRRRRDSCGDFHDINGSLITES